jgi:hypothetical protein
MVFCSNCGSNLPSGTEKFCSNCGQDLSKGGRVDNPQIEENRRGISISGTQGHVMGAGVSGSGNIIAENIAVLSPTPTQWNQILHPLKNLQIMHDVKSKPFYQA